MKYLIWIFFGFGLSKFDVKPARTWSARIIFIKTLPNYIFKNPPDFGTVGSGWASGYPKMYGPLTSTDDLIFQFFNTFSWSWNRIILLLKKLPFLFVSTFWSHFTTTHEYSNFIFDRQHNRQLLLSMSTTTWQSRYFSYIGTPIFNVKLLIYVYMMLEEKKCQLICLQRLFSWL